MSDSQRRLVLHIGMPKTGTTALQKFFYYNRAELLEQGILFPRLFAHENIGHFALAHKLAGTERGRTVSLSVEDLENEISESDATTVLISSETFGSHGIHHPVAERMADLAARMRLDPIIVVFLREQASYIQSLYAQRIKTGYSTDEFDPFVSSFIENEQLKYLTRLIHQVVWCRSDSFV